MRTHVKPFVEAFCSTARTDPPGVLEHIAEEKAQAVVQSIWRRFWDKVVFEEPELMAQKKRHAENKAIGEKLGDLDAYVDALKDYEKDHALCKLRELMLRNITLVDCYWDGKVEAPVRALPNVMGRTEFRRTPYERMQPNKSKSKFGSVSVQPFPFQMTFKYDDCDEKLFLSWHKRVGELGSSALQDPEDGKKCRQLWAVGCCCFCLLCS
jgi:hypothetical protein